MPNQAAIPARRPRPPFGSLRDGVFGLSLCGLIAMASVLAARLQTMLLGQPVLEPLVLVILLGAALRAVWSPPAGWRQGIDLGGRVLMEIAVMALGAGTDAGLILRQGPALPLAIAVLVTLGLAAGYAVSRALGVAPRLAVLIACGNAICGNSAIAAAAPVIGASAAEVAPAIAFTALLGAAVVMLLPALGSALGLTAHQFGTLAGMTVYAVPQVLAATLPAGLASAQTGTLVKLMRVLMLGPVLLGLSLARGRGARRLHLTQMLPWFILGFAALAALRTAGLLPGMVAQLAAALATPLSIVAMAALGLAVDGTTVLRQGHRAALAAALALLALTAIALGLLRLMPLG